jgi:hypothetical protein
MKARLRHKPISWEALEGYVNPKDLDFIFRPASGPNAYIVFYGTLAIGLATGV